MIINLNNLFSQTQMRESQFFIFLSAYLIFRGYWAYHHIQKWNVKSNLRKTIFLLTNLNLFLMVFFGDIWFINDICKIISKTCFYINFAKLFNRYFKPIRTFFFFCKEKTKIIWEPFIIYLNIIFKNDFLNFSFCFILSSPFKTEKTKGRKKEDNIIKFFGQRFLGNLRDFVMGPKPYSHNTNKLGLECLHQGLFPADKSLLSQPWDHPKKLQLWRRFEDQALRHAALITNAADLKMIDKIAYDEEKDWGEITKVTNVEFHYYYDKEIRREVGIQTILVRKEGPDCLFR